jgi:hypothetical protein
MSKNNPLISPTFSCIKLSHVFLFLKSGGVFIAMLAGLGMAAVTLVAEVLYHRRKLLQPSAPAVKKRIIKAPQPPAKKEPLDKKPVSILKKQPSVSNKNVTLGDKQGFESKTGLPKVSYITVYPKQ